MWPILSYYRCINRQSLFVLEILLYQISPLHGSMACDSALSLNIPREARLRGDAARSFMRVPSPFRLSSNQNSNRRENSTLPRIKLPLDDSISFSIFGFPVILFWIFVYCVYVSHQSEPGIEANLRRYFIFCITYFRNGGFWDERL